MSKGGDGKNQKNQNYQLFISFFVAFLLVDQEFCCTFAVALFGNVSEKAV